MLLRTLIMSMSSSKFGRRGTIWTTSIWIIRKTTIITPGVPWNPHIHPQIFGDNVYHYPEDHLNLYLYFFLVDEKGNAVDLLGSSDSNDHFKTQEDFNYCHYFKLIIDTDYLSKNLFWEYHYDLILLAVLYEYSYPIKIHHKNVHFIVLSDYRSREAYYQSYLNIASFIIFWGNCFGWLSYL